MLQYVHQLSYKLCLSVMLSAYNWFFRVFSEKKLPSVTEKGEHWEWTKTVKLQARKLWALRCYNALWSRWQLQSWMMISPPHPFHIEAVKWAIIKIYKNTDYCCFKLYACNVLQLKDRIGKSYRYHTARGESSQFLICPKIHSKVEMKLWWGYNSLR